MLWPFVTVTFHQMLYFTVGIFWPLKGCVTWIRIPYSYLFSQVLILQVEKNCKIKDSRKMLAKFTHAKFTLKLRKPWTLKIFLECVFLLHAENGCRKWMGSQSRNGVVLELFWKTSRFNLHLYLTEIESAIPFYLRATRTTQGKIGLSTFGEKKFSTSRRND